jgi:hypothetical protein
VNVRRSQPNTPSVCKECGKDFMTWPYKLRAGEGQFCSNACVGRNYVTTAEERFWSFVDKANDCWIWTGGTNRLGYGQFSVGRRGIPAHRFSYQLVNGPIPAGLFICHHCDNPPCVNPEHLFSGTQRDNMRDMMSKGRGVIGHDFHWKPESVLRGEATPFSVLTEAQVREIRQMHRPRIVTVADLADRYGVGRGTVKDVLSRATWRHVA